MRRGTSRRGRRPGVGSHSRSAAVAVAAAVGLLCCAPALATRAPDSGGEATSGFVAPPGGKWFGFAGIRHNADLDPTATARLIAGVRGNVARTGMHWQAIEQRRDVYSPAFDRYVELHEALRRRGIELIVVLQYAPAWARDAGTPQRCGRASACHYPPSRSMLGEWREFVADVAHRLPTATIEVWNAPNFHGQWQSGVDPARYAELLAAADAAVPGRRVINGGLGTSRKRRSLTAPHFLDRAYAATPSLKGRTDALNFHIYPGPRLGAGSAFARAFAAIRAVRAKHDDESTPLLVTETGATTTGPFAVGERAQARRTFRTSRKILTMTDTAGALLYTLIDRTELARSDHEHGFGCSPPPRADRGRSIRNALTASCVGPRGARMRAAGFGPGSPSGCARGELGREAGRRSGFGSGSGPAEPWCRCGGSGYASAARGGRCAASVAASGSAQWRRAGLSACGWGSARASERDVAGRGFASSPRRRT